MTAWIVPLELTHLTAFDAEWLPRLREMNQFDVAWDWRDWLRRSAGYSELEPLVLAEAV